MKWRLRGCPRCGGDIMIYDDYDGWHEACLQCGYHVDVGNLDAADYTPVDSGTDDPELTGYEILQRMSIGKD